MIYIWIGFFIQLPVGIRCYHTGHHRVIRVFILEKKIPRKIVYYRNCPSYPLPSYDIQIINPVLTSMIAANYSLWFLYIVASLFFRLMTQVWLKNCSRSRRAAILREMEAQMPQHPIKQTAKMNLNDGQTFMRWFLYLTSM